MHEFDVTFKIAGANLADAIAALDPVELNELSIRLVGQPKPLNPESVRAARTGTDVETGSRGMTPIRRAMMGALNGVDSATPADMKKAADAAGTNPSKSTLISGVQWLLKNGYIKKVGYGEYRLAKAAGFKF